MGVIEGGRRGRGVMERGEGRARRRGRRVVDGGRRVCGVRE